MEVGGWTWPMFKEYPVSIAAGLGLVGATELFDTMRYDDRMLFVFNSARPLQYMLCTCMFFDRACVVEGVGPSLDPCRVFNTHSTASRRTTVGVWPDYFF